MSNPRACPATRWVVLGAIVVTGCVATAPETESVEGAEKIRGMEPRRSPSGS